MFCKPGHTVSIFSKEYFQLPPPQKKKRKVSVRLCPLLSKVGRLYFLTPSEVLHEIPLQWRVTIIQGIAGCFLLLALIAAWQQHWKAVLELKSQAVSAAWTQSRTASLGPLWGMEVGGGFYRHACCALLLAHGRIKVWGLTWQCLEGF